MEDKKKNIEQGYELHKKGEVHEAIKLYLKAVPDFANNSKLLFLLGTANLQINNFEVSVDYLKKASLLDPNNIGIYNNLGGALQNLKKYEESIDVFKKLLSLNPKFAEAYNNIGNCYFLLNNYEEAIKNFKISIELNPKNFVAYLNIGNVYKNLKFFEKAITNYKKSIELNSNYFLAYNNLANVYKDKGKFEEAIIQYKKAIEINNRYVVAFENLGKIFHEVGKFNEASTNYKKAYELNKNHHFVLGRLIHSKMFCCEWEEIQNYLQILETGIKEKKKVSTPFELLSIIDNPEAHLLASKIFLKDQSIINNFETSKLKKNEFRKFKIGYFSPDFRNHPVLHLIKDVFKYHDKSKFEIYGFSFEKDKNDIFTDKIKSFFNEFIEVKDLSDKDIHKLTKKIGLDIVVDLCGHTAFNRIKLFSHRIAPIQVSYLGYPGTTGAKFIDYIIGDKTVIPEKEKKNYSEKVIYLPNCYQPNSEYIKLKNKSLNKEVYNLPKNKLIFCNFGANYKITPEIFNSWMNILKRVPNSVLWLLKSNEEVIKNLKKEAVKNGMSQDRIIFADKLSHEDHLKRFRLADIFLDTFPYGSHTTASDAIRMGVPIISLMGRSFASRVCASILESVGLKELITKTKNEFEEKAVYFGSNQNELLKLKERLIKNCESSSLFKIQNFTKQLESIYVNLIEKN